MVNFLLKNEVKVNEPCSPSDGFVFVIIYLSLHHSLKFGAPFGLLVQAVHNIINKFALVPYHEFDLRIKVADEQRK